MPMRPIPFEGNYGRLINFGKGRQLPVVPRRPMPFEGDMPAPGLPVAPNAVAGFDAPQPVQLNPGMNRLRRLRMLIARGMGGGSRY